MLEFKNCQYEKRYQADYAKQIAQWDYSLYLMTASMVPMAAPNLWTHRRLRSPLWHATFIVVLIISKGLPLYLNIAHRASYARHRTALLISVRFFEAYAGRAFLGFWLDWAHQESFWQWMLLAVVFGNNWLGLLFWGIAHRVPDNWWLGMQSLDLAEKFLTQRAMLAKVDPGMYHLQPVTNLVNIASARLWWTDCSISSQDLLLSIWMLLQLLGGFLLPCWLIYQCQLRSRRQWRQAVVGSGCRPPLAGGSSTGPSARYGPPRMSRDPGLDLRPVWRLHLPESVAFLVLSYVAGNKFQLLRHML